MYLDANNLYGLAMSQKFSVNGFKLKKNASNLIKTSLKIIMKIVIKAIFLMQTLNIQKLNLLNLHSDLSLLPEKIKIKKCNKPVCN